MFKILPMNDYEDDPPPLEGYINEHDEQQNKQKDEQEDNMTEQRLNNIKTENRKRRESDSHNYMIANRFSQMGIVVGIIEDDD